MTDADFAWLTGATWAVLLAAYGVRVARFGSFSSARVLRHPRRTDRAGDPARFGAGRAATLLP